jgi:hypothetical protein
MKAFFWFCLGMATVTLALTCEQLAASECLEAGNTWRESRWYELVGRCAAGPPRVSPPPREGREL